MKPERIPLTMLTPYSVEHGSHVAVSYQSKLVLATYSNFRDPRLTDEQVVRCIMSMQSDARTRTLVRAMLGADGLKLYAYIQHPERVRPDEFLDMLKLEPGDVDFEMRMIDLGLFTRRQVDRLERLSENTHQIELIGDQHQADQPIVVVKHRGVHHILDGNHRIAAAMRRGVKKLFGYYGDTGVIADQKEPQL